MKSKTLETLLANETARDAEMTTRFQALRDSRLISRGRGRNAEFLSINEIVHGIFSTVASRPKYAAITAIGLGKLKPVGLPEDAFAGAQNLASALAAALNSSDLLGSVKEIRLGDSDPIKGMATSAAIVYRDNGVDRQTQYVPETALSLFHKGKEKEFDRRSLGSPIAREIVLAPRLLFLIARKNLEATKYRHLYDAFENHVLTTA
jgi:hypothetical protein